MKIYFYILLLVFSSCSNNNDKEEFSIIIYKLQLPICHELRSPVPSNYYDAQPFRENQHLGSDLNAPTGGNSDLGEPFFSIGEGKVTLAKNIGGGWGNVIIIKHLLKDGGEIESLYGHADEIYVKEGDFVSIGDVIGVIGNNGGMYYAHLHFEIRKTATNIIGGGYSPDISNHYDPTEFILNY